MKTRLTGVVGRFTITPVMNEAGQLLRDLRCKKGWNLRQAAGHIGVSFPYVRKLETDGAVEPSREIIQRLARAYGYSADKIAAAFYGTNGDTPARGGS